jgi:hypothetical protein
MTKITEVSPFVLGEQPGPVHAENVSSNNFLAVHPTFRYQADRLSLTSVQRKIIPYHLFVVTEIWKKPNLGKKLTKKSKH